jgi:hypothetical protein
MNFSVSDDEAAQAAKILSKLTPGTIPSSIFHAIARLMALAIVELIPLRTTAGGVVEILLIPRGATDPIWPGQLHVPGTVVRSSDWAELLRQRL